MRRLVGPGHLGRRYGAWGHPPRDDGWRQGAHPADRFHGCRLPRSPEPAPVCGSPARGFDALSQHRIAIFQISHYQRMGRLLLHVSRGKKGIRDRKCRRPTKPNYTNSTHPGRRCQCHNCIIPACCLLHAANYSNPASSLGHKKSPAVGGTVIQSIAISYSEVTTKVIGCLRNAFT